MLLRPAWDSKDYNKARKAVDEITDMETLALIAKTSSNAIARYRAVERLEDKETLLAVAMTDLESIVCGTAADKIEDGEALVRIALNAKGSYARSSAVKRITEQDVIKQIALKDEKRHVRLEAVARLTDQSTLAQIAVSDTYKWICAAATERVSDEDLLQFIACFAEEWEARLAAYKKLRGEDEIYSAFKDNANYFYSGSGSERREQIENMIHRLEKDKFAARVFWRSLKAFNMDNHKISRNDSPGEDYRIDPFPPYPFGEEPKRH